MEMPVQNAVRAFFALKVYEVVVEKGTAQAYNITINIIACCLYDTGKVPQAWAVRGTNHASRELGGQSAGELLRSDRGIRQEKPAFFYPPRCQQAGGYREMAAGGGCAGAVSRCVCHGYVRSAGQ